MLRWLLPLVLTLATGNVSAATLQVSGGILTGAKGVDVGGTLYDVEFKDGSCVSLFGPCTGTMDFAFTSSSTAFQAAQALLDQVLLNQYDIQPELTRGCGDSALCQIWTPFTEVPGSVTVAFAENGAGAGNNQAIIANEDPNFDSSASTQVTYAVWSNAAQVPEPSSVALLSAGLLAFAASRCQRPTQK